MTNHLVRHEELLTVACGLDNAGQGALTRAASLVTTHELLRQCECYATKLESAYKGKPPKRRTRRVLPHVEHFGEIVL